LFTLAVVHSDLIVFFLCYVSSFLQQGMDFGIPSNGQRFVYGTRFGEVVFDRYAAVIVDDWRVEIEFCDWNV
jgi:hypothetical protein